jgi:hypothetical protein
LADDELDDRPRREDSRPDSGSSTGLIIGLCVGGGVLLLICGGVLLALLVPATQKVRVAAERTMKSNELKQIGLAYHEHHDRFKKPPAGPEDLKPFIEKFDAGVYEKLKAGEYVFIYNVGLKDMPMGSATIMGYHRDVPAQGGPVLFGDGSVRNLSVQEFRAAPQAAPGAELRKMP